ncbi:hypothetical protein K438DRAFT_2067201 [Mycena galopus ATCC 62051]|nr:hypothetical protein K438DRAFT_2067201 [Mycena galopus ATCC 62051]
MPRAGQRRERQGPLVATMAVNAPQLGPPPSSPPPLSPADLLGINSGSRIWQARRLAGLPVNGPISVNGPPPSVPPPAPPPAYFSPPSGWRLRRDQPLMDEDLYNDDARPPVLATPAPHHVWNLFMCKITSRLVIAPAIFAVIAIASCASAFGSSDNGSAPSHGESGPVNASKKNFKDLAARMAILHNHNATCALSWALEIRLVIYITINQLHPASSHFVSTMEASPSIVTDLQRGERFVNFDFVLRWAMPVDLGSEPTTAVSEEDSKSCAYLEGLRDTDTDPSEEPIFFASTFCDAIKYLPLCSGFEGVFDRLAGGKKIRRKHIFYVVNWDPEIYDTWLLTSGSGAAEMAWRRQGNPFRHVYATASLKEARDRAADWKLWSGSEAITSALCFCATHTMANPGRKSHKVKARIPTPVVGGTSSQESFRSADEQRTRTKIGVVEDTAGLAEEPTRWYQEDLRTSVVRLDPDFSYQLGDSLSCEPDNAAGDGIEVVFRPTPTTRFPNTVRNYRRKGRQDYSCTHSFKDRPLKACYVTRVGAQQKFMRNVRASGATIPGASVRIAGAAVVQNIATDTFHRGPA